MFALVRGETVQASIHVLLADRDSAHRRHVVSHLQEAGFYVVPASTGADVLLHCELAPPGVAVIDVRLSDMDGYDVCSQLRQVMSTRELPIILTTDAHDGFSRAYLAKMVEYAGGDFFLSKPYDINVLIQLIMELGQSVRSPGRARSGAFPTRVVWPTNQLRKQPATC